MKFMRIPIVNEQDEIIAYKTREEITREDIRRIVGLNIFNENDEILIEKRQSTKAIDPNVWGPAVAGTVDESYDYDDTMVKEMGEEIGLYTVKPIFVKKMYYETANSRRFTCVYYATINSNAFTPKIQESEVAEIKWINLNNLENWYKDRPQDFIPSFQRTINNIKEALELKQK